MKKWFYMKNKYTNKIYDVVACSIDEAKEIFESYI